jgi:aspartyl-tRNA(Asn)/glutamyl-tRNA(Gln) amidotransferase subunit C
MEMAKLSREDVLKLARLARLKLSDEEIERFQSEISAILGYVEQLQNVDLEGVEPTYQVTGLKDVTRPDEVKDYGTPPEELLKNAPATEDGHIKVKRMLI